ncbi:MAG TPA: hypothetical protein VMV82_03955 [Candidatus Dormibacteraeota bacterium]|nr:hypothetical protein [Candidatus Dormibacteraeota bacterium]
MLRGLSSIVILCALVGAAAVAAPAGPALPPQPRVHPAGIPRNAVLVSPCISTMGEHWAALRDLPNGPIYGVWQGKPVFTEIMVSVTQLQHGFSWANVRALPGYHIDHIDFEFEPHGHEGFPVPHYDLHAYYVSPAAQARICPNGIPDPAMKPTNH